MNIRFDRSFHTGVLSLSPGNYQVNIDVDSVQVILSNATGEFRLGATKRSSKMRVTKSSSKLRQVVGEPRWLLIIRTPPADKWVVSLQES